MVSMDSRVLYSAFLLILAVQRMFELRLSKRNATRAFLEGAKEAAPHQVPWMTAMHSLWFVSCAAEVWMGASFHQGIFVVSLAVTVIGQTLRYAAIRTLGPRWNVRIIHFPGKPPVQTGIYRLVRHPNYLGVVLEIAAVPMLHGAWMTSVAFSIINGIFLYFRIRAEENAVYG